MCDSRPSSASSRKPPHASAIWPALVIVASMPASARQCCSGAAGDFWSISRAAGSHSATRVGTAAVVPQRPPHRFRCARSGFVGRRTPRNYVPCPFPPLVQPQREFIRNLFRLVALVADEEVVQLGRVLDQVVELTRRPRSCRQ